MRPSRLIAAHLASEYPKDNAGRSVVLTPLADTVVGANQQGEITLAGGVFGPTVRAQIQSLDPSVAITNVQTIGEIIGQGLWAPRMGAALLGLFGGLALILAAVGLYGVLSYSVTQRTHEIGIRMALGAQPSTVLKLVVGEGLKLAAAGLVVGLIGAVLGVRVISSLLFNVSTYDAVTFVGVSLVLIVTAALACYIPARRTRGLTP